MDFKIGDTVKVDGLNVIMLNCSRDFKVTNLTPCVGSSVFIGVENEYEDGIVNKLYVTKVEMV